jgi:hypothetical protein
MQGHYGNAKGVPESESRTPGWVGSPAIGWLKFFLEPSAYALNIRIYQAEKQFFYLCNILRPTYDTKYH